MVDGDTLVLLFPAVDEAFVVNGCLMFEKLEVKPNGRLVLRGGEPGFKNMTTLSFPPPRRTASGEQPRKDALVFSRTSNIAIEFQAQPADTTDKP